MNIKEKISEEKKKYYVEITKNTDEDYLIHIKERSTNNTFKKFILLECFYNMIIEDALLDFFIEDLVLMGKI